MVALHSSASLHSLGMTFPTGDRFQVMPVWVSTCTETQNKSNVTFYSDRWLLTAKNSHKIHRHTFNSPAVYPLVLGRYRHLSSDKNRTFLPSGTEQQSTQVKLKYKRDVDRTALLTYDHTPTQKTAPPIITPVPYLEWKSWGAVDPCLTCRTARPGQQQNHGTVRATLQWIYTSRYSSNAFLTVTWVNTINGIKKDVKKGQITSSNTEEVKWTNLDFFALSYCWSDSRVKRWDAGCFHTKGPGPRPVWTQHLCLGRFHKLYLGLPEKVLSCDPLWKHSR